MPLTELYLMRHGIALPRDHDGCPPDPERSLTRTGLRKAEEALKGLRRLGVGPQVILTSPYLRARQTAEIALELLQLPSRALRVEKALKPAGPAHKILKKCVKTRLERVLCIGHAPNLDEVVAAAVGASEPFTALKKAGVACIDFPYADYTTGTLCWVLTPKVLRTLGG